MTLLLFIASLGIVHYIVSRQPGIDRPEPKRKPAHPAPEIASGLFALGEALERHGRGAAPRPQAAAQTESAREIEEVAVVKKLTS